MKKLKIFISSVQKEFKAERLALRDFITADPLCRRFSSIPELTTQLYAGLAHYIERAGTGTMDMIALCKKSGLPEPDFEQRDGQFVITIWRNWLTYEVMIGMELNDRQRKALVYIKENRRIANLEYQRVTGCIKKTASRDLDELVRKGVFAKFGSTGRGTFYGLVNKGDIKGTKGTFRGTYGKGDIKGTKPPQRRQREAGEDT